MKKLLLRPRSIAGAIAWGATSAVVAFLGLVAMDFVVAIYRSSFGPAQQITSVALGSGYSISLEATPAHPWLAEYRQSVKVYGGAPREGGLLGSIEIPANTGGRVRIGVLVPALSRGADVILVDRYFASRINLATRQISDASSFDSKGAIPLGIISGESFPVKFIPCAVWHLLSSEEQTEIIRPDERMRGFCDSAAAEYVHEPASSGSGR